MSNENNVDAMTHRRERYEHLEEKHREIVGQLREQIATLVRLAPLYPHRELEVSIAQLRFVATLATEGSMSTEDAAQWVWAASRIIDQLNA